MSVIGSEVIPLEYDGMDSESSLSPSSSERTVEERRERGVVEKEEEEIPSNIMEVKGNVGRCYDPELDIVSKVRGYVSELSSRSSLRGLVNNCYLSHHVLIKPAGVNERACSAPCDHWMPMYVHYLAAGLRARGKGEKGWYYFSPRSSSKENWSLFTTGPSSIKGWKEKFFFEDDTEWSRRDAEVEQLSAWKAKKTKQNNYKLNKDEVEEVGKLVREEGELVDIMYHTSAETIKAAELHGPSSLSEAEMDSFLNVVGGLAIPKKPRKKSKTSIAAAKGEEVSEEVAPLQRKKRKVAKPEARGDEVVEFVPRPSPAKVDPKVREREEVEVRGPGKGKELIPPPSFQKSLFEATNITGMKRFLNATLPEVDRRQVREEAVSQLGARIVRHSLEVNNLAQEYAESVRDCANLQRQCEELLKEKEDTLSTRLVFEECKRKICEDKIEAQDKYIEKMNKRMAELKKNVHQLVHNEMEEHIGNFLNSSIFKNIINLYRLPIAILAFTDCRKKRDAEGRTIFPPTFDAELVAVEEEEGVQDTEVKNQIDLAEVQPPEVHPISSGEEQLAPPEAEVPPLPAGDEPP
ncbi:hypothetical protein SLEP1_g24271 [Rubroshorea leprosula]|uniref:Uncharacterized protein n=1 Tax=Rubroshorea leprosula TaxID=152421 RepID=A0AAV5JI58_9ROSI|nr:hypothetical protein SLEP1_g24271 [Rubroshorea leprosula]